MSGGVLPSASCSVVRTFLFSSVQKASALFRRFVLAARSETCVFRERLQLRVFRLLRGRVAVTEERSFRNCLGRA